MREGYDVDSSKWFRTDSLEIAEITREKVKVIFDPNVDVKSSENKQELYMLVRLLGSLVDNCKIERGEIFRLKREFCRNTKDNGTLVHVVFKDGREYAKRHNNSQSFYFKW